MTSPTQSYRCSFSTLFLWIIVFLLVLDMLRMLFIEGIQLEDLEVLAHFNSIVIVSLISSFILVFALKSEISVKGITSYNWWGGSSFIPWEHISEAGFSNFFGLGFYRIVSADGTCVYVARYLSRQREFEMIVAAITARTNPLRQAIESKLKET